MKLQLRTGRVVRGEVFMWQEGIACSYVWWNNTVMFIECARVENLLQIFNKSLLDTPV
jgi:hypothetical protein